MARINLLPWRAERRKQRQRDFYAMLGAAALGGLLLSLLIWFYYGQQISGQQDRNQYLEQEIAKVKAQNEEIKTLGRQKDRLLARKAVIEELQAKRSQMVHLFDALVRTIPDGVVLTTLKQEGDVLTLEGRTQSNARVSAYMRNLESSGWMTNPDLSIIEAKAEEKGPAALSSESRSLPYVFTLKVKLANPNQADQKNGVTGAAIGPGTADAAAAATAPATPAVEKAATPAVAPTAAPAAAPVEKPAPATQERPAS